MNEHQYLAQRAQRMEGSAFKALDNPVRRHDAYGFAPVPNSGTRLPTDEAADMALELARDLCDPEGYGHAVPPEVIKRAARILAMLRPKVCERPSGVGYDAPPPARCEFCDES
jgi:hypothetical protein